MKPIDDADTMRNTEFLHKAELDIVPLASCWPGDEAGALSEEGYDASTGPNMDRALCNSDQLDRQQTGTTDWKLENVRSMTFRVCP